MYDNKKYNYFSLNYANGDGHNCYGVKLLYLQLVS